MTLPAPLWIPPTPAIIRRRPIVDPRRPVHDIVQPVWATPKEMLLGGPGGLWRPNPPTVRQLGGSRSSSSVSMDSGNTVVGNLLLCMDVIRGGGVVGPPAQESWTTIATCDWPQTGQLAVDNHMGVYATIVTTARSSYSWSLSQTCAFFMEVSHGSIAGIGTPLSVTSHASSPTADLGSLGAVYPWQLAVAFWGTGNDSVTLTITPGSWVRDYYIARDTITNSSNVLFSTFPFTYEAHQYGTLDGLWAPSSIQAAITLSQAGQYGGIAMVLS